MRCACLSCLGDNYGPNLEVRPVFHWSDHWVRAYVFLCVLAYHLDWHMRQVLTPHSLRRSPPRPNAPLRRCRPPAGARRQPSPLATAARFTASAQNLSATVLATPSAFGGPVLNVEKGSVRDVG
jgi:hypothetical protein